MCLLWPCQLFNWLHGLRKSLFYTLNTHIVSTPVGRGHSDSQRTTPAFSVSQCPSQRFVLTVQCCWLGWPPDVIASCCRDILCWHTFTHYVISSQHKQCVIQFITAQMPSFTLQRTQLIKVPLPGGHVHRHAAVYSQQASVFCQKKEMLNSRASLWTQVSVVMMTTLSSAAVHQVCLDHCIAISREFKGCINVTLVVQRTSTD